MQTLFEINANSRSKVEKMKLLVINDAKIYKNNGELFAKDTYPIFIKEISKHFAKVTMCSPIIEKSFTDIKKYSKFLSDNQKSNMECVSSFPYDSFIDYFKKLYKIPILTPKFVKLVKKSDAVLLRTNGLNIFFVAIICIYYSKPIFPYVVGYPEHVAKTGSKYKSPLIFFLGKLHTLCIKWLIRKASANLFVSEYLMNKLGMDKKDNQYVVYTNLVKSRDISYKSNDVLNKKYRLVFVGRLAHEKGLNYLIEAIKLLINNGTYVELCIIGDGNEKEKLESLCEELDIKQYCKFLGFISYGRKLNKVYQDSDIFVLPSLSEGIPKVLLEAMANGLPIIASDVGGIPEIIKDMENGILVTPKSPEVIAGAAKMIIEKDSLRKKLIQNGYNFVKEHTAEKEAEKVAKLIYKHDS